MPVKDRPTHRLIGVPFVDGGRDADGYDCWGLAQEVMRRYGKDVPDFSVSCFDTVLINALFEGERAKWSWLKTGTPEPGDLAVMNLDPLSPQMIQHVGVYVGDGRIIHTMKKRESHLVRIDDPYWSKKIKAWYRWTG